MHPVVIDQMARDHRTQLLAEAAVRRQQRAWAERNRRTPAWRTVPARALVRLARHLDPGAVRRTDPGGATRLGPCLEGVATGRS